MREKSGSREPGDRLSAREVNELGGVSDRMSSSRPGSYQGGLHSASAYGNASFPPWQQHLMIVTDVGRDDDEVVSSDESYSMFSSRSQMSSQSSFSSLSSISTSSKSSAGDSESSASVSGTVAPIPEEPSQGIALWDEDSGKWYIWQMACDCYGNALDMGESGDEDEVEQVGGGGGLWKGSFRYYDFTTGTWETDDERTWDIDATDLTDPEIEIKIGDKITVWWHEQRGKFIPIGVKPKNSAPKWIEFCLAETLTRDNDYATAVVKGHYGVSHPAFSVVVWNTSHIFEGEACC